MTAAALGLAVGRSGPVTLRSKSSSTTASSPGAGERTARFPGREEPAMFTRAASILSGQFPLHYRSTRDLAPDRHGQLQLFGRHRSHFRPGRHRIGVRERHVGNWNVDRCFDDRGLRPEHDLVHPRSQGSFGIAHRLCQWRRQYLRRAVRGAGTSISTSGSGACSGACRVSINGFFAGANAERAGFSYAVDGVTFNCGTPPCNAIGVVGLKR